MRINRNTSFPQPVLNFKDDFKTNNNFKFELYSELKENKYYFTFEFDLGNEFIKSLIEQNKAYYLIEIDCEDTLFRESFRKSEGDKLLIIEGNNLRDKFTIQVFICLNENISNYFCQDFNDDYFGSEISVDKDDVIGYGGECLLFAHKTWDPVKKISDFIKIRRSGMDGVHTPKLDMTDHTIYINVSNDDFEKYQNLKSFKNETASFFHSEYVLPALIEVLNCMNETEHDSYKWYSRLLYKIQSNDDLNRLYASENYYELAHAILKNPTAISLNKLNSYVTQIPEEDETEF